MRKVIGVVVVVLLAALVPLGCAPGDPLPESLYTSDIYPGTASTFVVGSDDLPYSEGWFDVLHTGTLELSNRVTLVDEGEVWLEFRFDLNWSSVQAHGVPTHVTRGVFDGYSLPIYGGGNEELLFEICVPGRWKGPAWEHLANVGDEPGGMAVYGDSLYIPMEGDDTVWKFINDTFSISGTVGDRPVYATVYNGDLYVTCYGDDEVWVFSGGVWALSGAVGNGPYGMVAAADGFLYVACNGGISHEIWRYSSGTGWNVDPALGLGGVAGAVGTEPLFMADYGGDIYVGCGGVDDDVWIRTGGAWAKDDDVDGDPQEFQVHDGDLYLNCYSDDTVWLKTGGAWAVCTNIQTDQGNAPIGLTEYDGALFSACMDSVWSDTHATGAHAIPFWNMNSDFTKVTVDEPMYLTEYDGKLYCAANANDTIWVFEGETARLEFKTWLASAQVNATDAYRLEVEFESFTCDADLVPATGEEVWIEILTGVAAQYQSYCASIPLDMTRIDNDDSLAIRIIRIASSDEIAGEVVIEHVGIVFKCDKIGNVVP